MNQDNKLSIAILGGGLAGLSAAWNLSMNGHKVTVIEKDGTVGGLSRSIQNKEFAYDLGPHNIHTRHENVLKFIKKSLGKELVQHKPIVEIFFRKRWVPYPLTGIHVFTSISPLTAIACGFNFLWTRIKAFFNKEMDRYDDNYETWIVRRFGRLLYNIYFAPYTEKVWKIPPNQLSVEIARKRLIVPSLFELVKAVLLRIQPNHPENPNMGEHYYPQRGAQQIVDLFLNDLLKNGTRFLTDATVTGINVKDSKIERVDYQSNGQKHSLQTDMVLSTIPINDCVAALSAHIPQHIVEAANHLDFTAMKLLYIHVNKEKVFKQHLAYFSEDEFLFNRIYDVSVWSSAMVPRGKTAICCEISCSLGDEIWKLSDEQIFAESVNTLTENGFLKNEDVAGYHVESITHAYPRFRDGYEKNVGKIYEHIQENIDNLITYGRQGLFAYVNMDDAILMGFKISEHIENKRRLALNYKAFFSKYIAW